MLNSIKNPEYRKNYFGYVYLWYDRKRKIFCLGSHHGSLDDGYITSTGWMMRAYKVRPNDFKRRVLVYNTENDKKRTRVLEQVWLDLIKFEELSIYENEQKGTVRYYNIKNFASGNNKPKRPLIEKKCFVCTKHFKVEHKDRNQLTCSRLCYHIRQKKIINGKNNHFYGKTHSLESKKKVSEANKGKPAWNKGIPNPLAAENGKRGAKKLSQTVTGRKRQYKDDGTWFWTYPNRKMEDSSVAR